MSNTTLMEPRMTGPSPEDLKVARRHSRKAGLFEPRAFEDRLPGSRFIMLRPDIQWKNPVMFTVEVGAVLTIIYTIANLLGCQSAAGIRYLLALDFWLVATLLFANFASAIAEARGKAQADALRKTRRATPARRLRMDGTTEPAVSTELRARDRVEVVAGEVIPSDGEIVEGVASHRRIGDYRRVSPRDPRGRRGSFGRHGGTRVLSDRIVVEITASPGGSFLDRMIALVEGPSANERPMKSPFPSYWPHFTLIFLIVTATLWPIAYNVELYMKDYLGLDHRLLSLGTDVPTLVALLVCLIPTTIGALLAAIGIAGMDRALRANIIAKSGKGSGSGRRRGHAALGQDGDDYRGQPPATQFVPVNGFHGGGSRTPSGPSVCRRRNARGQEYCGVVP